MALRSRVFARGRAAAALIVTLVASAPAGAQGTGAGGLVPGQRCIIDFLGSQGGRTTRTTFRKLPSGKYDVFIGGGFVGNCRGQDVTLQSDSAEYYGDMGLMYLIDNVHYAEPRARVDAEHMTYWMNEEHLRAERNVVAVSRSGSTMRGPVVDYYRAVAGVRDVASLVATGHPRLAIVEIDSVTGRPTDTVHVVADHITSVGDSLVYAGGDVRVTRPELLATGDSAFMDQTSGLARLMRKPTVEARRTRPFTLSGGVIDVFSRNRVVDRVVATPDGHATSQDVQLFADSIDLRVRANELERAMAWGRGRARAVSPEREVTADSIDVRLPGQRLREMVAVGRAYASSVPDSSVGRTRERDWMRGDTIIAQFDSLSPGDTASTPPIRTLVATTAARAFYHLRSSDTTDRRPAVNYVRGRVIDIAFADRAVRSVVVTDSASGVYVEPSDTAAPAPPAAPGAGPRTPGAPSRPTRPLPPPPAPARHAEEVR